jgi:hypothetical protein
MESPTPALMASLYLRIQGFNALIGSEIGFDGGDFGTEYFKGLSHNYANT